MSNALSGQVAALYIQTSTTSGAFTAEALTDQGDHKHYHQPDVTKQTWDSATTPTVEKRLVNKLSTSQGSNKDLKFVAKTYGVTPTITYTDPGSQGDLSVAVVGVDITVTLACNVGGEEISTASEIMAAVNADEDAAALVEAYLATGSDGSGVPAGMVQTALSGEADWATVSSGISIVYDTGQVVFGTALEEYDLVRASGYRFPVSVVAAATGWALSGGPKALKATVLGDTAEEYVAGNFEGTVSFKTLFTTGGQLSDYLGMTLQVLLFVDTGTDKTRFYGQVLLSSDDVEAQEGELVLQNVGGKFVETPSYYLVVDYSS